MVDRIVEALLPDCALVAECSCLIPDPLRGDWFLGKENHHVQPAASCVVFPVFVNLWCWHCLVRVPIQEHLDSDP